MSASQDRLLTALLREAGAQTVDVDGLPRARQEILAAMAWDYLIEGEVTLPSGAKLTATPREWINALKWLFAQIDGKPPREPKDAPSPQPHESSNLERDTEEKDFRSPSPSQDNSDVAEEPFSPPAPDVAWQEAQPSAPVSPSYVRATVVGLQPKWPTSPQAQRTSEAQADARPLPSARPPVPSLQADGRVVLIDRDDYDRRREEGFRNGSRYRIGDPDDRYARPRW